MSEFEKNWNLNRRVDEGVTEKSEDGAEEAVVSRSRSRSRSFSLNVPRREAEERL